MMISKIRWKQDSVALNTIETECIATNIASREAMWIYKLLAGLHSRHGTKRSSEAAILIHR
jgi:hypothetical protein